MKRIAIATLPYTVAILCSAAIMPAAIRYAEAERGYRAVGGEIFIPVLLLVLAYIMDQCFAALQMKLTRRHRVSHNTILPERRAGQDVKKRIGRVHCVPERGTFERRTCESRHSIDGGPTLPGDHRQT